MPGAEDVTMDFSALDRLEGEMTKDAADEIRLATIDLLGAAVNEAPVEEGTLRGSGSAHFGGRQVGAGPSAKRQAKRGAGGRFLPSSSPSPTPLEGGASSNDHAGTVVFNSAYAAAQHEGTDFAHPTGGSAKYLSGPLEKRAPHYFERIAARLARRIG
jgi:hypothetical protein